jgi:hypothetical protein
MQCSIIGWGDLVHCAWSVGTECELIATVLVIVMK